MLHQLSHPQLNPDQLNQTQPLKTFHHSVLQSDTKMFVVTVYLLNTKLLQPDMLGNVCMSFLPETCTHMLT